MKRELTTEQINRLYRYVNDKGVEYFDIQIELVDHIASIIEERWNNYSEQSVDETLNGVLVAFEKYGFKRLVREKERQVARQYRRYFWQNFKSFFSWPKVLFAAVLTWVLFEFIQKTNVNALQQISDSLMFPILGIALIYGIFLFVRRLLMLRKLSFTSYNIGGGFILFKRILQ